MGVIKTAASDLAFHDVKSQTDPVTGRIEEYAGAKRLKVDPRSYPLKHIGDLINDFSASTGVVFSGVMGVTGGTDTTIPTPEGGASTWVNCPIFAGSGYARITLTKDQIFADTDTVSFRIYVQDPSSIRSIQLTLVQSSTGATRARASSSDGQLEAGGFGWYTFSWKLSDFSTTGSPNYAAAFTSYIFQIGLGGSGGGQGKIAISDFRKNAKSSSYILFAQDSGYDSAWSMRDIFAKSGVPLNIYLNFADLGGSGKLTANQAKSLYSHESNAFEIASYPDYLPSLNHTLTGIAASQAVAGAGNLTLNGTLCFGGVATLGAARKVVLSTASVNKTIVFSITGELGGVAVSESIVGCWVAGGYVESKNYYDSVTQISVSAAITGNCTVGTSYSVAEHAEVISANAMRLESLGFVDAGQHVAYAGGQVSVALYTAMSNNGVSTGRPNLHSQLVPRNMLVHDKAFNPYLLSAQNAGVAVATALSMIDDVVSRGGVLVFYFHTIAATVDGLNPTASDLSAMVAYAKGKQDAGSVKCLKLSELLQIYKSSVNSV